MSNQLFLNSTTLLKNLISTKSYSGEENRIIVSANSKINLISN